MRGRLAVLSIPLVVATALSGALSATGPATAAPSNGWSRPALVWSAPRGAEAPTGLTQVVDSAGVVTAAWKVSSGDSATVMAARLGTSGWSRPKAVIRAPGGDPYLNVAMAVGPDDEVVVAASAEGASGVRFSAAVFAKGSWAPSTTLADYPDATSRVLHVYGLSAVSDDTGVSVLWQLMPNDSRTAQFVARGLPSGASDWTAPTILDDAATGTFAAVRDGTATVRAIWQHGADVVSAQGSARGWGAREIVGPSGVVDPSAQPYPDTYAAADTDGTVLVAWTQPDVALDGTCPATLTALHSASGWAPPVALPPMGYVFHCVREILPSVGPGQVPLVVAVNGDRWGSYANASAWTGDGWGPVQQTRGRPYLVGDGAVAIDVRQVIRPTSSPPEYHWLTGSSLTASGWSNPVRISDARGGWAGGFAGAERPDGSFVLVYEKRNPWRSIAVWAVAYDHGRWAKAQRIAAPVRVSADSHGAVLAEPVAGPRGRTTVTWILGSRVYASTSG